MYKIIIKGIKRHLLSFAFVIFRSGDCLTECKIGSFNAQKSDLLEADILSIGLTDKLHKFVRNW